jgi:purine-cytosine permease-like protein
MERFIGRDTPISICDRKLTTALVQAGGGLALLLVLIDETDNAFAAVYSAAVSTGTFWTRSSVLLLSAAYGALCTVIALAVAMAKYQKFLLLIGSVFAPLFGVVLVDHFPSSESAASMPRRSRTGRSAMATQRAGT